MEPILCTRVAVNQLVVNEWRASGGRVPHVKNEAAARQPHPKHSRMYVLQPIAVRHMHPDQNDPASRKHLTHRLHDTDILSNTFRWRQSCGQMTASCNGWVRW